MDQLISLLFRRAWKTTEFWTALVAALVPLLNQWLGWDLDTTELVTLVGALASFVLGRSVFKTAVVNKTTITANPAEESTEGVPTPPPVAG